MLYLTSVDPGHVHCGSVQVQGSVSGWGGGRALKITLKDFKNLINSLENTITIVWFIELFDSKGQQCAEIK